MRLTDNKPLALSIRDEHGYRNVGLNPTTVILKETLMPPINPTCSDCIGHLLKLWPELKGNTIEIEKKVLKAGYLDYDCETVKACLDKMKQSEREWDT